jgi:uncharacterized protein DUF6496
MSAPGIPEIATTTLRNRTMPIGPTRTKAQKQKVVHDEMHKFKNDTLHSGSKDGPKVKSRKQAVAIALSEAGMSKNKHAKQPRPVTNPGDYDSSAHGDADHARAGEKFRGPQPHHFDAEARAASDVSRGVGMQPTLPMRHQPPSNACGFGHSSSQRDGALRLSGAKNAHRIGAK